MNSKMYLMIIYLLIFIVQLSPSKAESESIKSILSDKYDSYGEDWIFMPDGNNNLQVAVLKGEEIESRGLFDVKVIYRLYTRSHIEEGIPLYINDSESIKNSDFSSKRSTKFLTHGWKSSGLSSGPINLKNAYLEQDDHNVIIVDWEGLASSTFYLGSMKNTKIVGADVAAFIDYLCTLTGADPTKMHFVGHSLGAHVAGDAGSYLTVGKLGRVTGLDPALPGFQGIVAVDKRLGKDCALFVDVIHTCGGVLGFFDAIGHVDFYPNGGVPVQRGCCCISEMMEACSHGRSYAYFTESITSKVGFMATKCSSWVDYTNGFCANSSTTFLGEFVDRSARGLYYLKTGSEAPFAIFHAD